MTKSKKSWERADYGKRKVPASARAGRATNVRETRDRCRTCGALVSFTTANGRLVALDDGDGSVHPCEDA